MLKANIINESLDNMIRNIINESKLTEDTINDEDELRSALTDAVSKLMEDRIINLKSYEIALQDAIEKVYPDYSWWEITSTNIFMDLFEKRDPWAVVDDIMNTLTIPDEDEEYQEYTPSLTSDDMNGGQWYESLKEDTREKILHISKNESLNEDSSDTYKYTGSVTFDNLKDPNHDSIDKNDLYSNLFDFNIKKDTSLDSKIRKAIKKVDYDIYMDDEDDHRYDDEDNDDSYDDYDDDNGSSGSISITIITNRILSEKEIDELENFYAEAGNESYFTGILDDLVLKKSIDKNTKKQLEHDCYMIVANGVKKFEETFIEPFKLYGYSNASISGGGVEKGEITGHYSFSYRYKNYNIYSGEHLIKISVDEIYSNPEKYINQIFNDLKDEWLREVKDVDSKSVDESLKESKKLDEKIPKDLSRSMRRDFKNQGYGYRSDSSRFNRDSSVGVNGVVDYENSTYQEVDADTIKQMKKNGEDLSNVYVVKNGEHIKLDSDGHPTWKSADARNIRSNQSLNKTLQDADKIYIADEKFVKDTQPEKFAQRHQDQEERNNNMNLGAYRSDDDDEKRYRKYMYRNDHKSKKAIERAKQDYEDGDISRKEMERIIANNQPEIDTWSGKHYQDIRNRKSDAINYSANKSASAKVSEYKELKRSIPEAERAISRAKDDIEKFNNGQSTSGWSDYGYNKRSADRYRKEIEDLERKLEFAKKQLQSYESKLTDDAKGSELKALEDKLAKANDDLEAKTSRLKALLRKNEALRRNNKAKELNEDKDLSKVEGSMTSVLEKNISKINSCSTVKEIVNTVKDILEKNGIDTKASQRLIKNIEKQKSLMGAFSTVYNSCLAGEGNATIK